MNTTLRLVFAVVVAVLANLVRPLGRKGRALCSRLMAYAWESAGVAYAITDGNLYFRNTTDSLTATETSSWLTIQGTPIDGLAYICDVPKKSVGDTLRIKLQYSEDGSNVREEDAFATVASVTEASTVPFKIVRRFVRGFKYVRHEITVAGTSPDFGAVVAYIGNGETDNLLQRGTVKTSYP